jgi:hypothetical protein
MGLALRLVGALDHRHSPCLAEDAFYAFSIARNLVDRSGEIVF